MVQSHVVQNIAEFIMLSYNCQGYAFPISYFKLCIHMYTCIGVRMCVCLRTRVRICVYDPQIRFWSYSLRDEAIYKFTRNERKNVSKCIALFGKKNLRLNFNFALFQHFLHCIFLTTIGHYCSLYLKLHFAL